MNLHIGEKGYILSLDFDGAEDNFNSESSKEFGVDDGPDNGTTEGVAEEIIEDIFGGRFSTAT